MKNVKLLKNKFAMVSLMSFLALFVILGSQVVNVQAVASPCASGPYHRFKAAGPAFVYDTSGNHLFDGGLYICDFCRDKFIAEGRPHYGEAIGRYCESTEFQIVGNLYWMSRATAYRVHPYTTTIPGYRFRAATN